MCAKIPTMSVVPGLLGCMRSGVQTLVMHHMLRTKMAVHYFLVNIFKKKLYVCIALEQNYLLPERKSKIAKTVLVIYSSKHSLTKKQTKKCHGKNQQQHHQQHHNSSPQHHDSSETTHVPQKVIKEGTNVLGKWRQGGIMGSWRRG